MMSLRGFRIRRRVWCLALLAGLVMLVLPSVSLADGSLTVTGTGDSTPGSCSGPTAAQTCTTLRAAFAEASVDPANGVITIKLTPGQTYQLAAALQPQGYSGGGVTQVVLDGQGAPIDLSGDTGSDAFILSGAIEFENLALDNYSVSGADLLYDNSPIVLSQVQFNNDTNGTNVAAGSTLTVTGAQFSNDSALGIATHAYSGMPAASISDMTFTNQTGPALNLDGTSATVSDVSISGGSGTSGAAVAVNTPATITGLSISGLTGDIIPLNIGAAASLTNVSVTGNQLDGRPAVEVSANVTVTGQNWTVADNQRTDSTTDVGAGILDDFGTLNLSFATLDDNTAPDASAGADLYSDDNGVVNLGESIISSAGTNGAAPCVAANNATITSKGFNIDQSGLCGLSGTGDANGANPKLGALTTSPISGLTYPVLLSYDALGNGSAAIQSVPKTDCIAGDELGNPRVQGTSGCDAGAYDPPLTKFTLSESGAPASANAGTAVTYTLTASNTNTSAPQHTVITDVLPAGATLTSASVAIPSGSTVPCTGTTTISCPVGTLADTQQAVATITATLNTAGADVDSASVTSEGPDVSGANVTASATTQVSAAPTSTNPTSTNPTPTTPTSTNPTPTTPTSTNPTTPTTVPLVISALKLSPVRYVTRAKATLTFIATAAGALAAKITKTEPGVKSGKACVAPPKHSPQKLTKCIRTVTVAGFAITARSGRNSVALPTKVRDLAPGTYKLTLGTKSVSFTVTKPKPKPKPKPKK